MSVIKKLVLALIILIVLSGVLGITSCDDKTEQVALTKAVTAAYERNRGQETYLFPSEEYKFRVEAKNPQNLPPKTTYLWTVIQTAGGDILKEYPVIEERRSSTDTFGIEFTKEGKYTVRCDLFDTEEFQTKFNAASRWGTIEHKFIVQEIKFEVTSELIGEGTYRLTPRITNPEILPELQSDDFRSPDYFEFNYDDGTAKEQLVSVPGSENNLTHEFVKEGTYNVKVEYVAYDSERDALTVGSTTLPVKVGGSDFWIELPSSPFIAGRDYTFRVMTSGLLPQALSYEWDFDGSNKVIIPFSNEITHVFKEAGPYVIHVEIFESEEEAAPVIGTAYVEINVEIDTGSSDIGLSIETNKEPPYEGGCSIMFIAKPNVDNQQLPENIRWEWDWGDGNKDENNGHPRSNKLYNEKSHAYQLQNTYTLTVKLYDGDNDTLLATATRDISIDNIGAIQRTTWAKATVYCGRTEQVERFKDGSWTVVSSDRKLFGWIGENSQGHNTDLIWKGNEFSVTWDYVSGTKTTTYTLSGKISSDATKVDTITATEDLIDTATGRTIKEVLTLTNVPLKKGNCGDDVVFKLWLVGADEFKNYITHYEYESKTAEEKTTFTGFDWAAQTDKPKLEVEFSAMD